MFVDHATSHGDLNAMPVLAIDRAELPVESVVFADEFRAWIDLL